MEKERIALFIDGANMFYVQKKLGWYIDCEKLYQYFAKEKRVHNAFFYTGVKRLQSETTFIRKLVHLGYTVRTKEVKEIRDEKGKIEEKCNLDIKIVIDMFNTLNNYDEALIFSGDSDFAEAIELLRSKGKTITVVSTEGMVAWNLVNTADNFIDIKKIRADIEKKPEMECPAE